MAKNEYFNIVHFIDFVPSNDRKPKPRMFQNLPETLFPQTAQLSSGCLQQQPVTGFVWTNLVIGQLHLQNTSSNLVCFNLLEGLRMAAGRFRLRPWLSSSSLTYSVSTEVVVPGILFGPIHRSAALLLPLPVSVVPPKSQLAKTTASRQPMTGTLIEFPAILLNSMSLPGPNRTLCHSRSLYVFLLQQTEYTQNTMYSVHPYSLCSVYIWPLGYSHSLFSLHYIII